MFTTNRHPSNVYFLSYFIFLQRSHLGYDLNHEMFDAAIAGNSWKYVNKSCFLFFYFRSPVTSIFYINYG